MKIALLAHNLHIAGGLSVGKNIVATLPEIAPMHQYLMIVPEGCGYPMFKYNPDVSVIQVPRSGFFKRVIFDLLQLPRIVKTFRPDWIWGLGNQAISTPPCSQSLLFHNSHRIYRSESRLGASLKDHIIKNIYDYSFEHGLRFCNRIYCQTNTMRQQLYDVCGVPLEKIGVCPNAFSSFVSPSDQWPEELESVQGKFILFCLTKYYSHKNLEIVVETVARYRDDLADVIFVLPISVDQGKNAVRLIGSIQSTGLSEQIICVGEIPQERLGEFFYAADVMFLPTLLESFSGTYLEAMHLETPILTSDRDFAHDVCGDAALYVDPLSPESVKDGIVCLRNNRVLREKLVREGQNRLKGFLRTWPEILKDVLDKEGIEHN